MSHRKFEAPRRGNLGFLPRKRCTRHRGKVKAFPRDNKSLKPHLTAFLGYKAGCTHIVREMDKPGSKMNKKEVLEKVTILETPPMVVVGVVAYKETPFGLKTLKTVWARHLSESFKRRTVKKWLHSKSKAFKGHFAKYTKNSSVKARSDAFRAMRNLATVIRVIAHTQVDKLGFSNQKKAHVVEIQVNGGTVKEKVAYARSLLEKYVSHDQVFKKDEMVDSISITKGHGFEGVIKRWGVRKLPRKTHKGLRKVACIGSWHPERVRYSVARAGQHGFHHRTQINKKIYMLGKSLAEGGKLAGKTEFDITEKGINPMGTFPHYGPVRQDFIMVKGAVAGPVCRPITLRKSLLNGKTRTAREVITLKFIDTSSKIGRGKFQTFKEKKKFMGPLKKDVEKKRKQEVAKLELEKRKKEEQKTEVPKETPKETPKVEKTKKQKKNK